MHASNIRDDFQSEPFDLSSRQKTEEGGKSKVYLEVPKKKEEEKKTKRKRNVLSNPLRGYWLTS